MADKIKIRRGNFINLPDLDSGEFGLSVDTGTLYVGTPDHNILINPVLESGDGYSIDGYLVPATDNVHNLGTPDSRWHSVFVGPGTINIVAKDSDAGHNSNKEFRIGVDSVTGTLQFVDENDNVLMTLDSEEGASFPAGGGGVDEGLAITVDEHYIQNSTAIQTVLKDLDGYAVIPNTAATGDGYLAFYTGVGRNLAGDNDLYWNRETNTFSVGQSSDTDALFRADNTNNRVVIGNNIGQFDTLTVHGTAVRIATFGNAAQGVLKFSQHASAPNIVGHESAGFSFNTISASSAVVIDDLGRVGMNAGAAPIVARLTAFGTGIGFPVTSGTTQSAGHVVRLKDSSNAILDIGGNASSGFWLQSTDQADLALEYPLLLNPNGGFVSIGKTIPTSALDVSGTITGLANISNENGANFTGLDSGHGVAGTGGATGEGGHFTASGATAVVGIAGGGNNWGASFAGFGSGIGVKGTGGGTSGVGVSGQGGSPNGIGVVGVGLGSGAGGFFQGGSTGVGITATPGAGSIVAGSFLGDINVSGSIVNKDLTETFQVIRQAADGYVTAPNTAAIADGYVAFFIDGGRQIAGDNDFYWDRLNSRLIIGGSETAVAPTLSFGDGDTGFYEQTDDTMRIAIAGSAIWRIDSSTLGTGISGGPILRNVVASSTNPSLAPNISDTDTGIGTSGADQLSLITGGIEAARFTTTSTNINGTLNIGGDIVNSNLTETIGAIRQAADGYASVPNLSSIADGYVAFFIDGGRQIAGDNDLFWDRLNNRLGVGTQAPSTTLHILGTITGTANTTNSDGAVFTGDGSGSGVSGTGGTGGTGVTGTGTGTGTGVVGQGGSTDGNGVTGFGSGLGIGVTGFGGSSSGTGISGVGGSTNGTGIIGTGQGSGAGGSFTGGATGAGIIATAGTGNFAGNFIGDITVAGAIYNNNLSETINTIRQASDGYLSDLTYKHASGTAGWSTYYVPWLNISSWSTGSLTANQLYGFPFIHGSEDRNIDDIAVQIVTGAAGNAIVGIYTATSSRNLYPDALVTSGVISTTSTGTISSSAAATLRAGQMYWLVWNANAAPVLRVPSSTAIPGILGVSPANTTNYGRIIVARTYDGTLPATFPASAALEASFTIGLYLQYTSA